MNSATILQQIPTSIITCCDYHRNYLTRLQNDAPYYVKLWGHVLQQALRYLPKKKEQAHFFDFGCGQGLFGAYAKFTGWQEVSMMDMHQHCVENAQKICNHLGFPNVRIGKGKEEAVADFFETSSKPDVLVSTDVIEHVYDIKKMLAQFKAALPNTILVFTTGAIAENPLRSKHMKRLQWEDEWGETDALQTSTDNPYAGMNFRMVRRKIIENASSHKPLPAEALEDLITRTRGQNNVDILSSVTKYLKDGTLPPLPTHPTNTCDPISSSWTERLLSISEYKKIFNSCGYQIEIHPGYYNDVSNSGIKRISLKLLNNFVQFFGLPQYSAYLLMVAIPQSQNSKS